MCSKAHPAPGATVACFSGQQQVPVTAGHTYFFMVNTGASTSITLDVQVATPPANDLIQNAALIPSVPFTISQSTQDATVSPTDPADCTGPNPNIWFRYDAPEQRAAAGHRVRRHGPVLGRCVRRFTGFVDTGHLHGCARAGAGHRGAHLLLQGLHRSSRHVDGECPGGDATRQRSHRERVRRSRRCRSSASRQPRTRPGVRPTPCRPAARPARTCGSATTAPSTQLLACATIASTSGAALAVFQGVPGSLTQLVCGSGNGEQLVQVVAGQSYVFMVSPSLGSGIRLSLQVATPPANDLIDNATPITGLPFTVAESTQDATRSPADPSASCLGATTTVWFRYDVPATQLLRLTPTPAFFSGGVVVYRGMPGSLTQIAVRILRSAAVRGHGRRDLLHHAGDLLGREHHARRDAARHRADAHRPRRHHRSGNGARRSSCRVRRDRRHDGAAPAPSVVCTPSSGSTFPVGDTVVDCTATDASGLSDHGTFTVHVTDTTAPELALPGTVTVDASGPTGATVDYAVGATDNADPNPVVICAPESGGAFAIGDTEVQCTATDASANTTQGVFTVHVSSALEQIANLRAVVTASTTSGLRSTLLTNVQDATGRRHQGQHGKGLWCAHRVHRASHGTVGQEAERAPGPAAHRGRHPHQRSHPLSDVDRLGVLCPTHEQPAVG